LNPVTRKLLIPSALAIATAAFHFVHLPSREVSAGEPPAAPTSRALAGVPAPNTDAYGDPLPAGAVARLGTVRLRPAHCLAFSPDGKTLATAEVGLIRFWDAATGRQVSQIAPRFHEEFCGAGFLAFSPDGHRLAALGRGHEVGVWNVRTGERLFCVELHTEGCVALPSNERLAFTPDGRMLWAGSNDVAFALDAATGKVMASVKHAGKDTEITAALAFSPDGNTFAAAPYQGKRVVELWSQAGGKPLLTLEVPEEDDGVRCLAFSHDGRLLAAGTGNGTTRVWHARTGKEAYRLKGPEVWIESVAFAPDGRALAAVGDVNAKSEDSEDRIIRVWDLTEPAKVGRAYPAPGFSRVTFSPDGKTLAGICFETCARLIDRATGQDLNNLAGHVGAIFAVAYAPDGKLVASAGKDHSIRLWDASTGKQLRVIEDHSDAVHTIAFSPDGRWLVSASGATVALWESATGRRLFHGEGPGGAAAVAFAPDGKSFASGGFDGPIRRWGVPTGKSLGVVEGSHEGQTTALAFSPDGKTLACGGIGTVLLRDAATGKVRRSLTNGQDTSTLMVNESRSLAFSPDGKTLAADSGQGTVLWETATGGVRSKLPGQVTRGSLAFSPDGRLLASGSAVKVRLGLGGLPPGPVDPVAHVWSLPTGAEIRTLAAHTEQVHAVAFSPDGTRLVTASEDSTALIWDMAAIRRSWSRSAAKRAAPTLSEPKELEAARAALAGEDAAKAYRAIQTLASSPEQAIPFLRRSLQPLLAPDKERVASLLDDFDSDHFETRERASAELQRLGDPTEGLLRDRLARNPSAESARRIRSLLERIESAYESKEVYFLRILEVLELAGTEDARRLLQELAAGAEGARLTRDARQSLQRLTARTGQLPKP
jgi:WD40 repeat protein